MPAPRFRLPRARRLLPTLLLSAVLTYPAVGWLQYTQGVEQSGAPATASTGPVDGASAGSGHPHVAPAGGTSPLARTGTPVPEAVAGDHAETLGTAAPTDAAGRVDHTAMAVQSGRDA